LTAAECIAEAFVILLKKKPYNDISISEICDRAGVTRMSFYRNYESKEDVIRKWLTNITDSFVADTKISYEHDSTQEYFTKLFTHMKKHQIICYSLYSSGQEQLLKHEFDRVFQTNYRDKYDTYKSYFISGGVYNVYLRWLINGCEESPDEVAEKLEGFLIRGSE